MALFKLFRRPSIIKKDCDEDCLGCPHLHVDCEGNDFYWDVTEDEEDD